jgi:hypothetical protein
MRYVLAAIFICAIGASAASATPVAGAASVGLSKADAQVSQVAKRSRAPAHKKSRGAGGIHPLVGSGEY